MKKKLKIIFKEYGIFIFLTLFLSVFFITDHYLEKTTDTGILEIIEQTVIDNTNIKKEEEIVHYLTLTKDNYSKVNISVKQYTVIPEKCIYKGTEHTITGIDKETFINSAIIDSLTLPDSIEFINDYAFYNCISLKEVIYKNKTYTKLDNLLEDLKNNNIKIGKDVFTNCAISVDNKFYTIEYIANGGKGEMESSVHNLDIKSNLSVNKFKRDGYKFIGWSTKASDEKPLYKDEEEILNLSAEHNSKIVLYALWQKETLTYTIEYVSSSGKILEKSSISKEYKSSHLIAPKKIEGYQTPKSQEVIWDTTAPKTITFVYEPEEYIYTLYFTSPTQRNERIILKRTYEEKKVTLPILKDTEEYTFIGWFDNSGYTGEMIKTCDKNLNTNFYASWELK